MDTTTVPNYHIPSQQAMEIVAFIHYIRLTIKRKSFLCQHSSDKPKKEYIAKLPLYTFNKVKMIMKIADW